MNGLLNVFVLSKGFWISQNHMNVALFPKIMIIMYQFTIYIIILMHFAVNWHILLHHFLLKEKYIADVNKYVHKVLEEKRDRCNAWQVYVCVKGFASSESQKLLRLKKRAVNCHFANLLFTSTNRFKFYIQFRELERKFLAEIE